MDELTKSIDALIDELFVEDDSVEKSMIKDMKAPETKADQVQPGEKVEDDDKRNAGRPKQISDVPDKDTDGKREGNYDSDIASENKDGKTAEQAQVEPPKEMKKALSDEEYAEYQELKKAKEEAAKEEALQKAKEEQTNLIKSAVMEATSGLREENAALKKSLEEQGELIKAMANKPQKSKAVTNIAALEKSFGKSEEGPQALSKAELMDVAEDLVKSGKLLDTHAIELENTGYIYDKAARDVLDREVKKRYGN